MWRRRWRCKYKRRGFQRSADQQGGSFIGTWRHSGNTSTVANATDNLATVTGTNQYSRKLSYQMMSTASGVWKTDPSPDIYYDLVPTSRCVAQPNTMSMLVDSDGRHITIHSCRGTCILDGGYKDRSGKNDHRMHQFGKYYHRCTGTGLYPAGATKYQFTISNTSDHYTLYGFAIAKQVTDQSGTVLTTLLALNTTFCDPTFLNVLVRQDSNLYNVLPGTSCTSANITAALSHSLDGIVTINFQTTSGSGEASSVLLIQLATGVSKMTKTVNMIYGLRGSFVWYGWMLLNGTYQTDPQYNKTAINAQLSADGLSVFW